MEVYWKIQSKYPTAIPREGRGPISERAAAEDKKRWMKKHFGVNNARIYAVMRKNKAKFCKGW